MNELLHVLGSKQSSCRLLGGKGFNLNKMAKMGLPIPEGFVVSSPVFERYLELNRIEQINNRISSKKKKGDSCYLEKACRKKQEQILFGKLPRGLTKAIITECQKLKTELFAVRSSALEEDGDNSSWAGTLDSFIGVRRSGIVAAIKKCWASFFSKRALFYGQDKPVSHALAVVVQKIVNSESAGVAFSRDPMSKKEEVVIEAGFGLGESVVSGMIKPDRYAVEKHRLELIELEINEQQSLVSTNNNARRQVKEDFFQRKLSDLQVRKIAWLCCYLEKEFKKPQDIEWAYQDGLLYLLQARPITFCTGAIRKSAGNKD